MSVGLNTGVLDSANPADWAAVPFETLFSLSQAEVEAAQRAALSQRFSDLSPRVTALGNLAARQKVEAVDDFDDVVPVLFDHQVYKSYPASLVEGRKFDRLTSWLQRLTTHPIADVDLDGARTVDSWLERLAEVTPLSVGHTTGTGGKLSFIPRSESEWPAFTNAYFELWRAMTGYDFRTEKMPWFSPGHRRAHYWLGGKLTRRLSEMDCGGREMRHPAFDYGLSSDLLSLAARLRTAEEQGNLDQIEIDPSILEERETLLERSRHEADDLRRWYLKMAEEYRGERVRIQGSTPDMVKVAQLGRELGVKCEFAPGSVLFSGGGLKGKDAPADWPQLLTDVFGIEPLSAFYGMTECLSDAPRCTHGYYHFFPYFLPIILDENYEPLPREGVQTGRMALFDFLAESYWGGFITGDRVTMYWDYDCECGWKSPRIDGNIARFSELDGTQDDKISCAGVTSAYNEFMDYIASI
jgi:hypothetical protein